MEYLGYSDAPIKRLKDDLFKVENYVNGLCNFILECETPMTISIQGDWGSGKTSMMNMIKDKLGNRILPIWFNTWQFSQFSLGNSLAISMLQVLLKELKGDTNALDKIANGMANAAGNVFLTAMELTLGSRMTGKTEDLIKGYSAKSCVQEITELKNKFQEAIAAKVKTPIERVVIFIDDLDRLEPAKAIELLEVLKLFIDCEKCVFVLAVDYEVVTLGIRQKYGSDINAAKGKSFFDKMIQLPFKMPVAQYDIRNYTRFMMARMHTLTANIDTFSDLIKTSVGLNPRSIKRLFNTYQLLYNIMPKKISSDEVKQRIQKRLFAVVCMQMSFGAVYDYLSDGNLDSDTLKNLAAVNDRAVNSFMRQRALSETNDDDNLNNDILSAIFDSKISEEELRETLQKLPAFINQFISAISANKADELSEKEINDLRETLKCSAITGEQGGKNDAKQQAVERRQENRDRVQEINKSLEKRNVGKFTIVQNMSSKDGIISTLAAGFCIYTGGDNKKYHLRYVIDYTEENKIAVSIYLNGYKQDPKEFYALMGKNPLENEKVLPIMNATPGWYFYDNVLVAEANDSIVNLIADEVEKAYYKLKEKLGDLK